MPTACGHNALCPPQANTKFLTMPPLAAVAALRRELRYYEAPPPDPVAIPEPVPGFASASGREEAPCDYAAAGYHIRRHSEREGAWL